MAHTYKVAAWGEEGLWSITLPTGWVVIVASDWEFMERIRPEHAANVSRDGWRAIYLRHSDGSMKAQIEEYRGGVRQWQVLHEREPTVDGEVPPPFAELLAGARERIRARPEVDWIYEAVLDFGLALTGFRFDHGLGGVGQGVVRGLEFYGRAPGAADPRLR